MRKITIDTKYTKTYKTKENLEKALLKLNFPATLTYVLVEVEGRFTALFTNTLSHTHPGANLQVSNAGFMVVG